MALEILHSCLAFRIRHMPTVPLLLRCGIHSGLSWDLNYRTILDKNNQQMDKKFVFLSLAFEMTLFCIAFVPNDWFVCIAHWRAGRRRSGRQHKPAILSVRRYRQYSLQTGVDVCLATHLSFHWIHWIKAITKTFCSPKYSILIFRRFWNWNFYFDKNLVHIEVNSRFLRIRGRSYRIHISKATEEKLRLTGDYLIQYRGEILLKGWSPSHRSFISLQLLSNRISVRL